MREKIVRAFGDGTFAWGGEGRFWSEIHPLHNGFLAPRIRSFYYTDGDNYHLWRGFAQFLWQTILVLSMAVALRYSQESDLQVVELTICGLFLFELLFEVRARYIYTCVPLFIVLAVIGLRELCCFPKKIGHN